MQNISSVGPEKSKSLPITFEDILRARERLRGIAIETPLIESAQLNEIAGRRIFLKLESLQRGGSFKFRGAYNRLAQLASEHGSNVVAWSSGNHGRAVAAAGRLMGIDVTLVMPSDAPEVKKAGARAEGARIVDYDRAHDDREAIARRIAATTNAVIVPSFDDPHIIAGQGTVALEAFAQCRAQGIVPKWLLVPCGGGGLTAGCALASAYDQPQLRVLAVEPSGFDDTARSLQAGERTRNTTLDGNICDGLLAPSPGRLTFDINRRFLNGAISVGEGEVARAMRFAFEELKLVVEPSGAVGLAAVMDRKLAMDESSDSSVIVILTGGNVDLSRFSAILEADLPGH